MTARTSITVLRPEAEVRSLWERSPETQYARGAGARASFTGAPGGKGTEVHVSLERGGLGGRVGHLAGKVAGALPLAKVMDDLRRFKQVAETGEVARSEHAPEGERAGRKVRRRPAQPLTDSERRKAGVS